MVPGTSRPQRYREGPSPASRVISQDTVGGLGEEKAPYLQLVGNKQNRLGLEVLLDSTVEDVVAHMGI